MRIPPDPYEKYPPRWLDFNSRAAIAYRVFTSAADVNRFAARYRLANAFRRLELEGYSDTTAKGYDSLTRIMLAWSALEALLVALRKTRRDIPEISRRLQHRDCLRDLRAADSSGRLFAFVLPRLDSARQKAEVTKYLSGADCCAITLAQGVRHIFLHGLLTPGANQAEPTSVVAVCDRLALAIRNTMDRLFVPKVEELVALAPAPVPQQDEDVPF